MDHNNGYDVYYMLEADKEWRLASKTAMAVYSYLNPGTYIFRVKASIIMALQVKRDHTHHCNQAAVLENMVVLLPACWLPEGILVWPRADEKKSGLTANAHQYCRQPAPWVNTALNNINILN